MDSWLLDVTRIASRLGRGALTGIDRVELAYLRYFLHPHFRISGLLRTPAGIMLLDRRGLVDLNRWAAGDPLPQGRDLLARMTRRKSPALGAVEAHLRRGAVARAPMLLSHRLLATRLPAGTCYLNTGHANLSGRMLAALKSLPGMKIGVLVHDTIPLDHPVLVRANGIGPFRQRLQAVADQADLVIHAAQATRAQTEAQLHRLGRVPPGVVAPLGIDQTAPDRAALPRGLDLTVPYFIALGTIEPRKNHELLLDVWDRLAATGGPLPKLLILGNRGWADADTLARLDRGQPGVQVLSGLSDGAVAALMQDARALLFPTLAEGYGLPALEAAALGLPVIATDLPVFREMLTDYPVYLASRDIYSWQETVMAFTQGSGFGRKNRRTVPTWPDHFGIVLQALR